MASGPERTLVLKLVSDVDSATKGIASIDSKLGMVGKAVGAFAALSIVDQAATAILGFTEDAVASASSISESTSKLGVVLGEASDDVEAFAQTAADSYGLSEETALEYGGSLAALFKALGKTDQAAADSSTEFLGLAADMASFNNTTVDEALVALQAGLRGESEPLRKFGVLLDDATLKAKAMELGLVDSTTKALDPQTKALAAQAVILEQTTDAQGDFARTSDGLANSQKKVTAQLANVTAEVGEALLPIVTELVNFIATTVVPIIRKLWAGFQAVAKVVGPLLAPLLDAIVELFVALWEAIEPIVSLILPPLLQLLSRLAKVILPLLVDWFRLAADGIKGAAKAIKDLVQWVKDAIAWVQKLLDKIPAIDLPDINPFGAAPATALTGVPEARGLGASSRSVASGAGGITVNVYASGDTIEAERAVVRALNRSVRLNAGLAAPVRWSTTPAGS